MISEVAKLARDNPLGDAELRRRKVHLVEGCEDHGRNQLPLRFCKPNLPLSDAGIQGQLRTADEMVPLSPELSNEQLPLAVCDVVERSQFTRVPSTDAGSSMNFKDERCRWVDLDGSVICVRHSGTYARNGSRSLVRGRTPAVELAPAYPGMGRTCAGKVAAFARSGRRSACAFRAAQFAAVPGVQLRHLLTSLVSYLS